MLDILANWLDPAIDQFTQLPFWPPLSFPTYYSNVLGLLATLVVCFICGALGSLVVGNRMSFFSDALAHCAFAGVGLGLLISLWTEAPDDFVRQRITLIMVCFGVTIGLLIALVRDRTGLASDTVIGVFYAAAVGLGAIFTRLAISGKKKFFNIEDFIFGNPLSAKSWEVVLLIGLALLTAVFLCVMYNWLILTSTNPSLALSRRVPVRLCRYSFIVLLALMVNLSQQITGTLLINGLLIVPAATASNLAGNLRQMFWYSIVIAVTLGLSGYLLSWEISARLKAYDPNLGVGISGTIVVLSALLFVLSMLPRRWLRRA
jgi:zinc transport system permease protein